MPHRLGNDWRRNWIDSPRFALHCQPATWEEYLRAIEEGGDNDHLIRPIGALVGSDRQCVVTGHMDWGDGKEELWSLLCRESSYRVPVHYGNTVVGQLRESPAVTYAPGWLDRFMGASELPEQCQSTFDARLVEKGYWVEGYACPVCDEIPDRPDVAFHPFHLRGSEPTVAFSYFGCCWHICGSQWERHPTADEGCERCGQCGSHCRCQTCPGCEERVQEWCRHCDSCDDCCRCETCGRCGYLFDDDSSCEACGNCDECCECDRLIHEYDYIPNELEFWKVVDEKPVVEHSSTRSRYHDKAGAPDAEVYLGLEIETEAVDGEPEDIAQVWDKSGFGYAKGDGSLDDGAECVSYPHTYEALRARDLAGTLQKMRSAGAKAWDTRTCGLHVHVSRKGFKDRAHMWRFAAAIYALESTLVKLAGRRSNDYASWDTNECQPRPTKVIAGKARQENRYVALNLQNEHTIELRFWKGSLQPRTVYGVCAMTDAFVGWTRNMSLAEVKTLSWQMFAIWAKDNLPAHQYSDLQTWTSARRVSLEAEAVEVVDLAALRPALSS